MHSVVLITCPNSSVAETIADTLVSRKLAACVNIIPSIKSVYVWEGKVERSDELLLMAKTQSKLIPSLTEVVKDMHPYECPEIIGLNIEGDMGSATSSQTRDVTFHPDDIVISDGVIDRIKEAAASIDNEKDETYASKSSKTEHSIVLRHELEEAERRYERRLQLLERRVGFCFGLINATYYIFPYILT
ncbi:Protein CutA [Schistosoma japonicum]|nr:Protein CutA [Schistosoma japonicum]KAH8860632.1 Protein CutA [Schistosoma japonicum]